jgi:hypothetical protein
MHERGDLRPYLQISCHAHAGVSFNVATRCAARVSSAFDAFDEARAHTHFCAIVGQRGARALRSGANQAVEPGEAKRV